MRLILARLANIPRYWRTVRHLRWKQIVYRLYYAWRVPKAKHIKGPIGIRALSPAFPAWQEPGWKNERTVRFLNLEKRLPEQRKWEVAESLLWKYHLHYFDDLAAKSAAAHRALHSSLISEWIDAVTDQTSPAWDPYPTSLRVVNWTKFLLRNREQYQNDPRALHCLAVQAESIFKRLEYHLLGNHLLANAKALVFAGIVLESRRSLAWLYRGLEVLDQQLPEQFLKDGAHYERSPMYHNLVLWDLFDLIRIVSSSGIGEIDQRLPSWRALATRALEWSKMLSHPDGEIAFFNDAALGGSPAVPDLIAYARELGLIPQYDEDQPSREEIVVRRSVSGYTVVEGPIYKAILDTAPVGPDFLPGHAHADTLSFELSVSEHRLLVNGGASTYAAGRRRDWERSTEAHNTVEVAGLNSSETWGAFRVGARAYPVGYQCREISGKGWEVVCGHSGYLHSGVNTLHRRRWTFFERGFEIQDELEGDCTEGAAFFYLHPDCTLESHPPDSLRIRVGREAINVEVTNGRLSLVDVQWAEALGCLRDTTGIKVIFKDRLSIEFSI